MKIPSFFICRQGSEAIFIEYAQDMVETFLGGDPVFPLASPLIVAVLDFFEIYIVPKNIVETIVEIERVALGKLPCQADHGTNLFEIVVDDIGRIERVGQLDGDIRTDGQMVYVVIDLEPMSESHIPPSFFTSVDIFFSTVGELRTFSEREPPFARTVGEKQVEMGPMPQVPVFFSVSAFFAVVPYRNKRVGSPHPEPFIYLVGEAK